MVVALPQNAGAHETLTPGDTATGITAAVITPTTGVFSGITAIGALITVESNTVTFCIDGSTPTAAAGTNVGHKMTNGQSYFINGTRSLLMFQCIDTVSGSAGKVKVTTFF